MKTIKSLIDTNDSFYTMINKDKFLRTYMYYHMEKEFNDLTRELGSDEETIINRFIELNNKLNGLDKQFAKAIFDYGSSLWQDMMIMGLEPKIILKDFEHRSQPPLYDDIESMKNYEKFLRHSILKQSIVVGGALFFLDVVVKKMKYSLEAINLTLYDDALDYLKYFQLIAFYVDKKFINCKSFSKIVKIENEKRTELQYIISADNFVLNIYELIKSSIMSLNEASNIEIRYVNSIEKEQIVNLMKSEEMELWLWRFSKRIFKIHVDTKLDDIIYSDGKYKCMVVGNEKEVSYNKLIYELFTSSYKKLQDFLYI